MSHSQRTLPSLWKIRSHQRRHGLAFQDSGNVAFHHFSVVRMDDRHPQVAVGGVLFRGIAGRRLASETVLRRYGYPVVNLDRIGVGGHCPEELAVTLLARTKVGFRLDTASHLVLQFLVACASPRHNFA